MAKNAQEETHQSMEEMAIEVLKSSATNVTLPTVICGVNRKINTGNFENIDVYTGIALPVAIFPQVDIETFKQAVSEAAEMGFRIAADETGARYATIKELQSGK